MHPRLSEALDISFDVLLFELDLDALLTAQKPKYKTISKYPMIRRDLSFFVDIHISSKQIEQAIIGVMQEDWLKAFNVFDVYTGEGVPSGKKSLAIALTLQDDKRTLVDSEINLLISAIIKTLEQEFSIVLRD